MEPHYKTTENLSWGHGGENMPEETKRALESLNKSADKLTPEQLQRISDIAYGMSLVKEARADDNGQAGENERQA